MLKLNCNHTLRYKVQWGLILLYQLRVSQQGNGYSTIPNIRPSVAQFLFYKPINVSRRRYDSDTVNIVCLYKQYDSRIKRDRNVKKEHASVSAKFLWLQLLKNISPAPANFKQHGFYIQQERPIYLLSVSLQQTKCYLNVQSERQLRRLYPHIKAVRKAARVLLFSY